LKRLKKNTFNLSNLFKDKNNNKLVILILILHKHRLINHKKSDKSKEHILI